MAQRHRDEPRQHDEQEYGGAPPGEQPAHGGTRHERVRDYHQEWDCQRDRPLGEGSDAHRGPRGDGPVFDKPEDSGGRAERQGAVEDCGARVGERQHHRGIGEPGDPPRILAPAAPGKPGEQHHRREGREVGGQAGGGFRWPEGRHRPRRRDEVGDWLVEVGQPVEMRHEVIARGDHLARDFGVAAFIGVEQAVAVQIPAEGDRREEHKHRQSAGRARWQQRGGENNLAV